MSDRPNPLLASLLDLFMPRRHGLDAEPTGLRLSAPQRPALIYAIGDIHGCLDQLLDLEARIVADAAATAGEKWMVCLGDYIDRGPKSAQVIDHLMTPPHQGFRRICLRGNHETAMLDALRDPSVIEDWFRFGGDATMESYGLSFSQIELLGGRGRSSTKLQLLQAHIPDEHIQFLEGLPVMLGVPGFIFVHAGLRPHVELERQAEYDLIWIRGEFLDADHDFGAIVVHGHTPADEPTSLRFRVGIDTGCYMNGRLTAVRIDEAGSLRFLQTGV